MYDIFEKLNSRNRMYDIFEKTWIRQNRMYDIFGNSWHWAEPNVRYFSGLSQTSKTECTIFFRVRKSTHFVAFSDCAYHSNGFEKHSEGFITLFLANCFFSNGDKQNGFCFWETQQHRPWPKRIYGFAPKLKQSKTECTIFLRKLELGRTECTIFFRFRQTVKT